MLVLINYVCVAVAARVEESSSLVVDQEGVCVGVDNLAWRRER